MPVPVSKIGHIVLRVEDLGPALAFYCGALGLKEVARRDFGEGPMAFLSTGYSHHDIALVAADPPNSGRGSLHHFALKVGDSLPDLRHVKQALTAKGIVVHMSLDSSGPTPWPSASSRRSNRRTLTRRPVHDR
jgi:catechol 2,3-dioxygenase-like lactoylglutathione lyase family enzyme